MWYWFVPLPSQKTVQPGPAEHHVYTSNLELTIISSLGGIGYMLADAWSLSCVEHDTEHLKGGLSWLWGKMVDCWVSFPFGRLNDQLFSAIVQPTFNVCWPLVPWLQPHPTTQIKEIGYNRLESTAGYQTVLLPHELNWYHRSRWISQCEIAVPGTSPSESGRHSLQYL